MGLFDPSWGRVVIFLVVVALAAAGLWLLIRSAVRSGVKGAGRDTHDRMDEVRRWEESQRNLPR